MIAKDLQEAYEAVIAMRQQLADLGVRELTTFGNVTRPAESFAEAVLLECNKDRVAQLTRDQPEQASAFLSVLGDVHAELSSVCGAPGLAAATPARTHTLAAEAVIYAVKARRRRDEGYSGMYLSYPKDD